MRASILFFTFAVVLCTAVRTAAADPPNVILVSIDTLRADRLGCYGNERATSPAIDALAEGAVRFENCMAQASSTLPSHASLLTSLYPSQHGANTMTRSPLRSDVPVLAGILKDAGYRTASFNGGGQLAPVFGLDRGFEVYLSEVGADALPKNLGMRKNVERAIGWMEAVRDSPFFLFIHTYDVHHPYTPSEDYARMFDPDYSGSLPDAISVELLGEINNKKRLLEPGDLEHIVALYDAEIRMVDDILGEFFAHLKERGLWDKTLVIVTSDHGEEFGERGSVGMHWHTLNRELLHVPLILSWPGHLPAGRVVQTWVPLLDVAPTVLELLGMESPAGFEGRSLLPLLDHDARDDVAIYAERERSDDKLQPMGTAFTDGHIKIQKNFTGQWEWTLYDLATDPLEKHSLFEAGDPLSEKWRDYLESWIALQQSEREGREESKAAISETTQKRLEALGYLKK